MRQTTICSFSGTGLLSQSEEPSGRLGSIQQLPRGALMEVEMADLNVCVWCPGEKGAVS